MKRVVSLYLPHWPIDRLRRAERRFTPPVEADSRAASDAIGAGASAEREHHCSVPKEGNWRPGARWAKTAPDADGPSANPRAALLAAIEAMPAHRRPPPRELGRTSEPAGAPFKANATRKGLLRPPEERAFTPAPLHELSRSSEAAKPAFRPGPRGWNGAGMPPLQFPGEDAPAKANRGAALRDDAQLTIDDRYRKRPSVKPVARAAVPHPGSILGEDAAARDAMRNPRRSARDGHGGEAGYIAPANVARSLHQLTAMPPVQFPGEGPHADSDGKGGAAALDGRHGRFFQTGRTLASVVARVCRDNDDAARMAVRDADPPLVVTLKRGSRVEVVSANAPAQALGIVPGVALTLARAQIPGLEVRAADPEGDAAGLRALAELLARRWAPVVAISDADGLFIDLTGVAHLYGGEDGFCRRLIRLLARHSVTARVVVADSAGAAWALARFGVATPTQILAVGGNAEALAPLPVSALRLDAPALELLARLGIDTIGQLSAMPRAPLVRRFGRAIADRLDQAAGLAPEPLDPVVPATRILVEQRFAEPIATPEVIGHWIGVLMAKLAVELARAGQGARLVELVAARIDGVPQCLRLGFAAPTRDSAHMIRLALRRMEEIEPGFGIDAVGLIVLRADPLGPVSIGPVLADEGETDLALLIDALANRIGAGRLWRITPVESDVPERSCTPTGPLAPPPARVQSLRADDVRRLDTRAPDHPWHPRWPRPVLLLRRPERVDHILAELPDQPPRRFTWRGKPHRVVRAEGPERIAGEWWYRAPERRAVRDYFRVEDETGQRFWLFRRGDGVRGETGDLSWFVHGLGN